MPHPSQFSIDGIFWINKGDELFMGPNQYRLFSQVIKDGSILAASQNLKVSYQHAWKTIDRMNSLSPLPLVSRHKGGYAGGGCQVSNFGMQVLKLIEDKDVQFEKFLSEINKDFDLCSF
jgi:molybdate transport system regulatory protein